MKKKKKVILIISGLLLGLLIALTLIYLIGGGGDVIVEPTWYVGVDGAEAPVFTSIDYGQMRESSMELGEDTWQGVYLQDALKKLGVNEYSSLTLTAADGAVKEFSRQAILAAKPMIAHKLNGQRLRDAEGLLCVWIVCEQGEDGLWVEALDKIAVNE